MVCEETRRTCSKRERPLEIIVLKSAGHTVDLGRTRADRLGGLTHVAVTDATSLMMTVVSSWAASV